MARMCERNIFPTASDLFLKALTLHNTTAGEDKQALVDALRADIETFLSDHEIASAEDRGWNLEFPLRRLFEEAINGTRSLTFNMVTTMDRNSRGLYAYFVNILRGKLLEEGGEWEVARSLGFELEKPCLMPPEEETVFSTTRFPLEENTRRFLVSTEKTLRFLAQMIVFGGTEMEWRTMNEFILPGDFFKTMCSFTKCVVAF